MRAVRRLTIILVILCGLFVGADRIAVNLAQSQVASKLQSSRGLQQKPGVSIEGFPFLTQLLGGKLDEVKVHATGMVVQGPGGPSVTLQDFYADLKGVRLENDYSTAVADTATGSALISYAELSAVLPNHPTVSYAGGSKVKVTGTVDLPVLGQQTVSGTAGVDVVSGNTIGITDIGDLSGVSGISGLSSAAAGLAATFLQPQFQLVGLPGGLRLTQIQAQPGGVSVSVAGTGVSLNSTSD